MHLDVPHRKCKTPRVVDQHITLAGCSAPLRQLLIRDLGHDEPTILVTNDLRASPKSLITRYTKRMLIENAWPTRSTSFIWMPRPRPSH